MYNSHSSQVFVIQDIHFDEAYYFNKKDLKSQEFADNEWYKEDDKFFTYPTDILDANKPISEYNTIFQ